MENVSPSEEEINIFIFKFVYFIKQIYANKSSQNFTNEQFAVQAAF